MAALSLTGVSKTFPGPVRAVDGFSVEVADGTLAVLVGPSGCGKTTVLRMVAGLERPSAGRIVLGGRDLDGVPPRSRDVAMVFEGQALYPHLDVRRNIGFALRLRKTPRAEIHERVAETAGRLGIESLLDRRPDALSAGQRRRVALARALVRRPKLLLLDEPLANLDLRLRERLADEIRRVWTDQRLTILMVTHHQDDAMGLGQQVIAMRQGRIQQVGPPADLYDRPANRFVAELLGRPAMNLIEGRLAQTGDTLRFTADPLSIDVPATWSSRLLDHVGKPILLGVRPEHVAIQEPAGPGPVALGSAEVENLERLGCAPWVPGRAGGRCLPARAGPAPPAPGQRVHLTVRPEDLHFFDAATGQSLG